MADCVLPEELMICILTRLPVKTIVRFKSVCKPWDHLFSTPEFKKLHFGQFSSDPENQSLIVHSFCSDFSEPKNQFSIFNIECGMKRPTILNHPSAHAQEIELDTVGCCNGLICIRRNREIVLWNPAMKLYKNVPLKIWGIFEMMSLGFGYDAIGDDYKVVRIVGMRSMENGKGMNVTSVEIYSVNLGSWFTIDVGYQFSEFEAKNNLIVNGKPYWIAQVDGNEVLVCFDVLELVFKIVPFPVICFIDVDEETDTETCVELVDWNGAVGAIIINYKVKSCLGSVCLVCSARVKCVWVFDDIKQTWTNNHTFGPIEVDANLEKVLHCTKNEKILTLSSRKLSVVDLKSGCVKELFESTCLGGDSFDVHGYSESLAYINGMEKVVVKHERGD